MKSLKLSHIILTFMCIFGFSLVHGSQPDSQILVGAYLCLYMLFHPGYLRLTLRMTIKNRFIWIAGFFLLMNCWSLFIIGVNSSNDLSFLKTLFHMFIVFLISYFLFAYFQYLGDAENMVNYIVIAFMAQTVIQWASFLSPIFRNMILFTKTPGSIEHINLYGGLRGNSLTGPNFFGLSAAYALFFLLYWSKRNTLSRKNSALKIFLYILTGTGTFFAGRTGYVGLGVTIVYLATRMKKKVSFSTIEFLTGLGVTVCFFMIIAACISQFRADERFHWLFSFTFQNIINWFKTGNASSSSLEALKNMYFLPSMKTLFFGDGQYTDFKTGGYYMHTDVGYLRVIFFCGVIGFLLLLCVQIGMLHLSRGDRRLKQTLLLLLMILNLKGEVIAWGVILIPMITLYGSADIHAGIDRMSNFREIQVSNLRKEALRLWLTLRY